MGKYKVVIVEDEPPILRNIKQKVEASGVNFEVSGIAYDGVEALSVIDNDKPHLILTDINIPLVNGISLIEKVRAKYPDTVIVIISGYQEFEYARKAMKMGVEDYLLKPVTLETMQELLSNIKIRLDIEMEKREREYFANTLTMGDQHPIPIGLISVTNTLYHVLAFCFGPYSTGTVNLIYSGSVLENNREIEEFFKVRLLANENCWVFNGSFTNEKTVILAVNETHENDVISIVQELITCNFGINIPVTISISNKVVFGEFSKTYKIVKQLLQRRLILGKSQVLYDEIISSTCSFVVNSDIEKKLSNIIQHSDKRLLKLELQKLFTSWEKQDCPQSSLDKLLKHILSMLQRQVFTREFSNSPNIDLQVNEILSTSLSFNDAFEGFWLLVEDLFGLQRQINNSADESQQLISKVLEYMKKNIAEPITLPSLAAMVNLVPQYFCTLFKKHTGMSPIEFLINLKIDRAKELFDAYPDMLVKDIAEMVGYSDQHYFSKIFKTTTGFTPKEYKHNQLDPSDI